VNQRPIIERDPEVSSLVNRVKQQMFDIAQTMDCPDIGPKNEVTFVSFEDALKELIQLKNTKS
jgi:hypothetical protein